MGGRAGGAERGALRAWGAATAVVVLLCPVSSRAQETPPATQPTFRTETNLVEVVAVVTGEDDRSLGAVLAAILPGRAPTRRLHIVSARTQTGMRSRLTSIRRSAGMRV